MIQRPRSCHREKRPRCLHSPLGKSLRYSIPSTETPWLTCRPNPCDRGVAPPVAQSWCSILGRSYPDYQQRRISNRERLTAQNDILYDKPCTRMRSSATILTCYRGDSGIDGPNFPLDHVLNPQVENAATGRHIPYPGRLVTRP